jgi:hypothetical protein
MALSTMIPLASSQLNFNGTTLPRLNVGVFVEFAYGDKSPLKVRVDTVWGVTIATAHVEKCPTIFEKRTMDGGPLVG